MAPKFSVIIPAYMSEEYIGRLLDSIRAQTFTDYEIIVVCDSCYDRTEEVAKSYGARTFRVEYGLDGLARDRGVEEATGEWVLFADDDDWFLHEYCFRQLADMAGKHGEDVLCFSFIKRYVGYIRQEPEDLLGDNCANVWSKCWKRTSIGNAKFGSARYCSDRHFIKEFLQGKKRAVFWDMPIYYYNFYREGSQTDRLNRGEILMGRVAYRGREG